MTCKRPVVPVLPSLPDDGNEKQERIGKIRGSASGYVTITFMPHRGRKIPVISLVLIAVLGVWPRTADAEDRPWEQLEPEVERLYQEERYAQLAAIAEEALRAAEHTFGRNDPKVAALIINLSHAQRAVALETIADYSRSETLLARAIKILEEAHGPDHPEVAAAVNSLGELYSLQADYREAEPLFQRALAVWERAKGPNDPQVA